MEELTLNREPRSPAKKRSLDAMRRPSANQSHGPVPMMIDGEGPTDSSSADSAPSGADESFEQVCDRHVRRFLKASPLKPRDKEGFGKSQQGLEHGDRTPSGGVYMATGVPRMHGGGNCLGSSDSIGSGKSDVSSQGDPSELSPGGMKPAQQISPQVDAGQSNPGLQTDPQTDPPNPGVAGEESENLGLSGRLRGGSADLEITDVAKFFAGGETETKDSQPRGFEPLDLPSSSTQGQAVLPEPEGGEEDSPPSRDVPNFPYFRNPGTLLSRDPGASAQKPQTSSGPSTSRGGTGQSPPDASPSPPGTDQSPQGTDRSAQGTDQSPRGTDSTQPTSPQSFHQRVEFLSQQFIDPPNPGSSDSHSGRSSFDSKPPSSSSPEDGPRDGSPRGGEPVPWRELFDLLPEARMRGGSAAHPPASQPGTSSQPGPSTSRPSAVSRPRRSFTLSPIASPDRSIVLPGLPDDLAVLCLARVPRAVLARVVCVSKAWSVLIRSEELYKVRGENGLREPWLYALCESPRWGPWRVYDPMFSRWHILPSPLPGADRQLVHAKFSTIALHEKMLVIGGCYFRSGDPTEGTMLEMDQHALRDLRVYDPVKNRWSWAEQMNIARRSFAIGEIGGKVYVAGGLGQNGELLSSAEVYDPSTNRWTMLPSMSVARYGCAGAVLHGKLWAYAGRQQTGEENPGGWKASLSAEVYDPIHATWRTVDEMWMRRDLPNPAAVLDELLYTVDCEDDCNGARPSKQPPEGQAVLGENLGKIHDGSPRKVYTPSELLSIFTKRRNGIVPTLPSSDQTLDPQLALGDALPQSCGAPVYKDVQRIKCYQEPTNSWTVVDRLPLPAEFKHAGSRLVAFNNELYMLGGTIFYRDGDLNRGRNVNTVEVFDPKAQARGEVSWRSAPNMGEGRGGIWGCAVLNL